MRNVCFSCLVEVRDEVPLRRVLRVLVGPHVDVEVDLDKVVISKTLKDIHLIDQRLVFIVYYLGGFGFEQFMMKSLLIKLK